MSGTLFIVSTPIGHPDDLTLRARDVLSAVDTIAAEDTRNSQRLLDQLGLKKRLVSYHDHNEQARSNQLVERLLEGEQVALVSDAGTPLISDPGYRLVRECHARGVRVVPVPGASALLSALVVAGLPTDRFQFTGFLPAKGKARDDAILAVMAADCTSVVYEAPHRLQSLLAAIEAADPGREIALCRELTKRFETVLTGTVAEVAARVASDSDQLRGEMVVVVSPATGSSQSDQELLSLGGLLLKELSPSRAAKVLAAWSGRPRNEVYSLLETLAQ